jgi:hypothetical protein
VLIWIILIISSQGGPLLLQFATTLEGAAGEDAAAKMNEDIVDTVENKTEHFEAMADLAPAAIVLPAEVSVMDFARYCRQVPTSTVHATKFPDPLHRWL